MLKEFDSITIFNKDIMIWYFWDDFYSSIRAQIDEYKRNLDTWDKAIKKVINVETKASRQLSLSIWEIDVQCFWEARLVKTKEKPMDKKLAIFSYSFLANLRSKSRHSSLGYISGSLFLWKDSCYQSQGKTSATLAIGVNTTAIKKKSKDNKENKDLNQFEYYYYKQLSYYTTNASRSQKTSIS